ncbi:MAG: 6-phosphogluconolactonase [Planctomycetota bacterium]
MAITIQRFASSEAVAEAISQRLIRSACQTEPQFVSLSGGSTPRRMFELLGTQAKDPAAEHVDWSRVHFFWGDERCVAPDDAQSNFGVADQLFFSPANVADTNVHRVLGELDPPQSQRQYDAELKQFVPQTSGLPVFDLMLLGMGDDGHTASIFPDRLDLLTSDQLSEVAIHPTSGQSRITLTGPVIGAAKEIVFLVTGENKASVLASIVDSKPGCETFPTYHICQSAEVTFLVDEAAASQLSVSAE